MFKRSKSGIAFCLSLFGSIICHSLFFVNQKFFYHQNSMNKALIFSCSCNSPGIMLLIFNKGASHVPLKILSIEDGTVLKSFHHLIHRNKKVDFIEQFNEKLLVKQENENLQILDVRLPRLFSVVGTVIIFNSYCFKFSS